jgi:hypothetical protein
MRELRRAAAEAVCAAQAPLPQTASLFDIAEMAVRVATKDRNEIRPGSPIRSVDARGGVVEYHVAMDPPAGLTTEQNRAHGVNSIVNQHQTVGMITGFKCGQYRDYLLRGLVLNVELTLPDGFPVTRFKIDPVDLLAIDALAIEAQPNCGSAFLRRAARRAGGRRAIAQ